MRAMFLLLLVLGAEAVSVSSQTGLSAELFQKLGEPDNTDPIVMPETWIDDIFLGVFGKHSGAFASMSRASTMGVYVILGFSLVLTVISIVAAIATYSSRSRTRVTHSKAIAITLSLAWICAFLYMGIVGGHLIILNQLLASIILYEFDFQKIAKNLQISIPLYEPGFSDKPPTVSNFVPTRVHSASPKRETFCSRLWDPNNVTVAQYLPGSAIYDFNLRLVDLYRGSEDVDRLRMRVQRAQSIGLPTPVAREFGGISNECEEENGDVERCCDKVGCQAHPDPSACLELRCPGRALYERSSRSWCGCITHMQRLGIHVEMGDAGNCIVEFGSKIINYFGSSEDELVVPDCTGLYDGAVAIGEGIDQQVYSVSNFTDAYEFESQSQFLRPSVQPMTNVTFSLFNCSVPGNMAFRVRYLNPTDSDIHADVLFDGQRRAELRFPQGTNPRSWKKDVTFDVMTPVGGSHVLSLRYVSGGNGASLPWIHKLAVCADSKTCWE